MDLSGTSTRCMGLLRQRFALWSKRTNLLPVGAVSNRAYQTEFRLIYLRIQRVTERIAEQVKR